MLNAARPLSPESLGSSNFGAFVLTSTEYLKKNTASCSRFEPDARNDAALREKPHSGEWTMNAEVANCRSTCANGITFMELENPFIRWQHYGPLAMGIDAAFSLSGCSAGRCRSAANAFSTKRWPTAEPFDNLRLLFLQELQDAYPGTVT
ncbi:MAG: hypothetical protein R3C12_21610 [Planctomycetaceae bacterium]